MAEDDDDEEEERGGLEINYKIDDDGDEDDDELDSLDNCSLFVWAGK